MRTDRRIDDRSSILVAMETTTRWAVEIIGRLRFAFDGEVYKVGAASRNVRLVFSCTNLRTWTAFAFRIIGLICSRVGTVTRCELLFILVEVVISDCVRIND